MSTYTADQFATHLQSRGAAASVAARGRKTFVIAGHDAGSLTAYFGGRAGRFSFALVSTVTRPGGRPTTTITRSLKRALDALELPAPTKV